MASVPLQLQALLRTARVKHFPRGQIVIYEGDSVSDVFIVKNGVVKLYDIDMQGNEKILHIVTTPALIPFVFFSGENLRTKWFYSALTDSDLYVLPGADVRRAVESNHEVGTCLMNHFSQDVHELLVRLSSLGKTKARDKIIASLRFLMVCHATERRNGWWRVTFAVNHQLLADMVGITRERAAVVMKELQDEKIIRNPRLTVLEIRKSALDELE